MAFESSLGKVKIPTSPDKVYRNVAGDAAISDLFTSGEVRSRGMAQEYVSKRSDQVYWVKGEEGKHHGLNEGNHIIEAPHSIASERAVRDYEVTGIYKIGDGGEAENRLEELRAKLGMTKEKK